MRHIDTFEVVSELYDGEVMKNKRLFAVLLVFAVGMGLLFFWLARRSPSLQTNPPATLTTTQAESKGGVQVVAAAQKSSTGIQNNPQMALPVVLGLLAKRQDLPKRFADVKRTPELEKALERWPDTEDKLDYLYRFADKLAQCLQENNFAISFRGNLDITLHFASSRDQKVGTGEEFVVDDPSVLTEKDREMLMQCGLEAHLNEEMILTNINMDKSHGVGYRTDINFPLEDSFFYKFARGEIQ